MRLSFPILACTLAVGTCLPPSSANAQVPQLKKEIRFLTAGRYLAPDGSIKEDVLVRVNDGKIASVGKRDESYDRRYAVEHPNAVLAPGLIDLDVKIGAEYQSTANAFAIDPAASMINSVDWNHDQMRGAVRAGVTTVMLTPTANNVVGGAAAVVKTARIRSGAGVLRDDGPLMFSLGPQTFSGDRAPTSRIGALAMLRDTLSEAGEGNAHPRLKSFVNGKLDGMVVCEKAMDVSSALRAFRTVGEAVIVRYTGDEADLAGELSSMSRALVAGPYDATTSSRTMAAAGAIARAGVPVVFSSGIPAGAPDGLRLSASLAARHGMDSKQARRAMTILPAIAAGVSDRVGSIYKGLDADFVVFSDDPLRLDAQVLEVYVSGVRVYDASIQTE